MDLSRVWLHTGVRGDGQQVGGASGGPGETAGWLGRD